MAGLLDLLFGGAGGAGLLGGPGSMNFGAGDPSQAQAPQFALPQFAPAMAQPQGTEAMAQATPAAMQQPSMQPGQIAGGFPAMLSMIAPRFGRPMLQQQMTQAALQTLMSQGMSLPQAMFTLQNPKIQESNYGYQKLDQGQNLVSPVTGRTIASGGVKPLNVDAGASAIDPNTGRVIYQSPNKPMSAPAGASVIQPDTGKVVFSSASGLEPQTVDALAKRALGGDNSVFSAAGNGTLGATNRAAILNRMTELGASPDQTAAARAAFETQLKATSDFGTGQQGNTVRSLSVAVDHLALARQLAQALQNGDVRALNAIKNVWQQEFKGSPIPTTFDAVKHIVSDEITKAVVNSGGAMGDREHIAEPLNKANSMQQLLGVIDQGYIPLMTGQLHGLKLQYEQTTKKDDFYNNLTDRAFSTLAGIPEQAASALKANPSLRDQFEAKYGKGTAARLLGK